MTFTLENSETDFKRTKQSVLVCHYCKKPGHKIKKKNESPREEVPVTRVESVNKPGALQQKGVI